MRCLKMLHGWCEKGFERILIFFDALNDQREDPFHLYFLRPEWRTEAGTEFQYIVVVILLIVTQYCLIEVYWAYGIIYDFTSHAYGDLWLLVSMEMWNIVCQKRCRYHWFDDKSKDVMLRFWQLFFSSEYCIDHSLFGVHHFSPYCLGPNSTVAIASVPFLGTNTIGPLFTRFAPVELYFSAKILPWMSACACFFNIN